MKLKLLIIMKIIFSLLFSIGFFIQSSFGQDNLQLYKEIISRYSSSIDAYNTKSIIDYEYDTYGNTLSKITTDYYSDTLTNLNIHSNIRKREGVFYVYDSEHQLIKETYRDYNKDVDLWITSSWFEYSYNSNGCLEVTLYTQNVGIGGGARVEYERNEDCLITKQTLLRESFPSGVLMIDYIIERTYFQENNSFQFNTFLPTDTLGEFYLSIIGEYIFNSFGKEERYSYSSYDSSTNQVVYEFKRESDFDLHGNIIYSEINERNDDSSDWVLRNFHDYENEYDDQDRLLMSEDVYNSVSQNSIFIGNTIHEYLCPSDTFPSSTITLEYNGIMWKSDFIYDGKNDCFDIENEVLEMSVFPNPTIGMITINSSIFKSGDTQVSIFDMNGKFLLEKNESSQCELMEFDLGDFPKGMYVVQLMNQDHFVQERVIKLMD